MSFDPKRVANWIAEAHQQRKTFSNVPAAFAPLTVADAYAAQEALVPLWEPSKGPVAGLKIATTTKVMQALMGIDHPCGGMIYARQIHVSPKVIDKADHMNVVVECELALRLGEDLPARSTPYERADVRRAIGSVMPAFELIEDRNAVYKDCNALSLIADNAWNAGIVIGTERPLPPQLDLNGLAGHLSINGSAAHEGRTDDPLGALAWVANLAVDRGRPMSRGMVVITGSVIKTLPIGAGARFVFSLDGLGEVALSAR
jgi:2-keto-4-pentenoate hydratase